MHFELSPLIVWNALWKVNTYSEFHVYTFSNNRDMRKCQFYLSQKRGLILKKNNAF